jgi:uncharacterized protein YjbI with pentapeptide repeats
MFKQFYGASILSILLLLLCFVEVASSNSLVTLNSDLELPVCYFRSESGQVLNLENLCRQPTINNLNSTTQSADIKRLLITKECSGCNLSGANLANATLTFVNLLNANLSGANLSGAKLIGANLANANLSNADLKGAKLNGAKLINTNLNGANLANANMLGVNLWGTKLNGARLDSTKMPDGTLYK